MDDNSRIGDRIAFFDELLNVLESGTDEATVNYVNLSFNHLIASFLYVKTYREAKFSKSKAENTFFISLATHFMTENLENKLTLKELPLISAIRNLICTGFSSRKPAMRR